MTSVDWMPDARFLKCPGCGGVGYGAFAVIQGEVETLQDKINNLDIVLTCNHCGFVGIMDKWQRGNLTWENRNNL